MNDPKKTDTTVEEHRIPVVGEKATISKRIVEGGKVRIDSRVFERNEILETTLRHSLVDIQRKPVDKVVDSLPEIRKEGDVLIIPVVEERARVIHELVLVEEIHVQQAVEEEKVKIPVATKATEVNIERDDT